MLNLKKFKALMEQRDSILVSIYIPTNRAGNAQADHLRYKNALSKAKEMLKLKGLSEKDALAFLRKGYELLDQDDFWIHLSDGLAIFLKDDMMEHYLVPIKFNNFVYVGNEFYLRPLFPVISGEDRFFLLAFSQNKVRFFEGDLYGITPVIIDDLVPANMEKALQLDSEKSNVQMHSGRGAAQAPVFHSHATEEDQKLSQLKTYFRLIDDGLMKMLHDEKVPMILACVDYYAPIYKEITRYVNVADVHIGGNPDNEKPAMLHEKSWQIMKNFIKSRKDEIIDKYDELIGTGKATYNMLEALPAAKEGKIDSLFLHKDRYSWGQYREKDHEVEIHKERKSEDVELLNEIALETFKNGGVVYTVEHEEMPKPTAEVCAVYRYE
jgi:hypothetical protein